MRTYDFGKYEQAIQRWEIIHGVIAPPPTEPGSKQQPVLSPRFVEWMMGVPEGWVTDTALSRTQQLRMLGNGVVPLQAEAALRTLLAMAPPQTEEGVA